MTKPIPRFAAMGLLAATLSFSLAASDEESPARTELPLGHFEMAYPFPHPEGDRLVFQGDFSGNWHLYELTLTDGSIRRLTEGSGDHTHPAYSNNGRQIALISNSNGNDEVAILDLESGNLAIVDAHPGKDGHPKWSPDDQWLVFNRTFDPADPGGGLDSAIVRVRVDGTGFEVLSDTDHVETFASYSPDGDRVAYIEWFPNAAGQPQRNAEVMVVEIESGQRKRLTNNDHFDAYPYWGQAGEWIYHTELYRDEAGKLHGDLMRTHAVTSKSEPVHLAGQEKAVPMRAIPNRSESEVFFNIGSDGRVELFSAPIDSR